MPKNWMCWRNNSSQDLSYYTEHRDAAEQLVKIGLTPAPSNLDKAELASWTLVARVVLNLNEVITRN